MIVLKPSISLKKIGTPFFCWCSAAMIKQLTKTNLGREVSQKHLKESLGRSSGRNLKLGTEAEVTEEYRLLMCFLIQPGTTFMGEGTKHCPQWFVAFHINHNQENTPGMPTVQSDRDNSLI